MLKLDDCSFQNIERFYILEVLKLFGMLARYKLCSIVFWRKAVKFVEFVIEKELYRDL